MDKETLKKAKELESLINECDSLLESKKDMFYWCSIEVECGNSNTGPLHSATLPRAIWNKMLDVLRIERDKFAEELNSM